MARLSIFACMSGAMVVYLGVGAQSPSSADSSGSRASPRWTRARTACSARFTSDDAPLPKPPRPHPIDGTPDLPQPRPARERRADRRPLAQPATPSPSARPVPPAEPPIVAPLPPTGVDRGAVQRGARQFRVLLAQGRVHFVNVERDRAQIDSLCADGTFQWPAPAAAQPRHDLPAPELSSPSTQNGISDDSRSDHSDRTVKTSLQGIPQDTGAFGLAPQVRPAPSFIPVEPPAELFRMLNALAENSTDRKPLAITSLLRPPYRTARYYMQSPTNPHALGIAVDIAAFGGHSITTTDPEEEVQALLALLKALQPGRYRIGMPKAPTPPAHAPGIDVPAPDTVADEPSGADSLGDGDRGRSLPALPSRGTRRSDSPRPRATLPSRGTQRQDNLRGATPPTASDNGIDPLNDADVTAKPWPFFPAPQKGVDEKGKPLVRFANERYAPEQFINDARIRTALLEARRRGVDVIAVFPDGVNHIHLDVKQNP